MTARNGFRVLSRPSVSKRAQRWESGNTTGERQDKGARGAPRSGDGISTTCRTFARCALAEATSRKRHILNDVRILVRCAALRP